MPPAISPICANVKPLCIRHFTQKFKKMHAEGIIQEDRSTLDPTGHHVIPTTRNIYP